jgi:hypothetical protein
MAQACGHERRLWWTDELFHELGTDDGYQDMFVLYTHFIFLVSKKPKDRLFSHLWWYLSAYRKVEARNAQSV